MLINQLKYTLIFLLMITYINRGLFVSSPEAEYAASFISAKGEINSMVEFLHKVIGGYENEEDEDGDFSESYHFAKTVQLLTDQHLTQILEFKQPYTIVHNALLNLDEIIYLIIIYGTIDHPPENLI